MDRPVAFLVAVSLVILSAFVVAKIVPVGEREAGPKIFEEIDEIVMLVKDNGDVEGWARLSLPRSELSDFMGMLTRSVGEDVLKEDYESSWRSSFAMLGTTVGSIDIDIDAAENFTLFIRWTSPQVARWENGMWVLEMAWVDPEQAAAEILDSILTSWLTVSSIAKEYGYVGCVMRVSSVTRTILPEWAENVWCNALGDGEYFEYGRGSYSRSRFQLERENGRFVLVESSEEVLDTRHVIEAGVENILENNVPLVLRYSGPEPGVDFDRLLSRVRIDLKFGRARDRYDLTGGGAGSLTLGQILYNVSLFLLGGESGFSPVFVPLEIQGEEIGDWDSVKVELHRENLLSLASEIAGLAGTGKIPASLQTAWGRMRYRDVLYTFLRLIEDGRDSVVFLPVPEGNLVWMGENVSAKVAYYLLPDSYVITGTPGVRAVLDNLTATGLRELAEEICNWTGSNIRYSLSFRPPTSEEVLENRSGQCRDYSNVYLAVARTAGLPARRVNGWVESGWNPPAGWGFGATTTPDGVRVILHAWVQVYVPGEGWLDVEPQSRRPDLYVGELPYRVYVGLEQSWTEAIADYEAAGGRL